MRLAVLHPVNRAVRPLPAGRPVELAGPGALDTLDGTAQIDRSAQDAPERLGRLTTYEARCTG